MKISLDSKIEEREALDELKGWESEIQSLVASCVSVAKEE